MTEPPEKTEPMPKNVISGAASDAESTLVQNIRQAAAYTSEQLQTLGRNTVNTGMQSVKENAYPIMMESLQKIIVDGESPDEVAEKAVIQLTQQVAEDVKEQAIEQGKAIATELTEKAKEELLKRAEKLMGSKSGQLIQHFAASPVGGQIVALGTAVADSMMRYLSGEITEDECIESIAANGKVIVFEAVLTPFVGPIIASVAVNVMMKAAELHNKISEFQAQLDSYLLLEKQIQAMQEQALAEMQMQRERFHDTVQAHLDEWDNTVESGLGQMIESSYGDKFSLEDMVAGLDQILSVCGKNAKFHSVSEWESQLGLPLDFSF